MGLSTFSSLEVIEGQTIEVWRRSVVSAVPALHVLGGPPDRHSGLCLLADRAVTKPVERGCA